MFESPIPPAITPDSAAAAKQRSSRGAAANPAPTPRDALPITPDITDAIDAAVAVAATQPRQRRDGWTGERQRTFLEAIANGDPIDFACRRVDMTRAAAYAFRSRPNGAAFAAAWDAAANMCRFSFADYLMQRVIEGVEVETNTMDGRMTVRRVYDHRLAVALLNRMDRIADRAQQRADAARQAGDAAPPPVAAIVEQYWGDFLDRIEQANDDDIDSDTAMVDAFIAEHAPADKNRVSCQICQLRPEYAEGADRDNAMNLEAYSDQVTGMIREDADGALTTCLPAADPDETGDLGQWRACTPAEAGAYRRWQAAAARIDRLEAATLRTSFFAELSDITDTLEGWANEHGAEAEGQTKPDL